MNQSISGFSPFLPPSPPTDGKKTKKPVSRGISRLFQQKKDGGKVSQLIHKAMTSLSRTLAKMRKKKGLPKDSPEPSPIKSKVALLPPKKKVALLPPKKKVALLPPKKKVAFLPPKKPLKKNAPIHKKRALFFPPKVPPQTSPKPNKAEIAIALKRISPPKPERTFEYDKK